MDDSQRNMTETGREDDDDHKQQQRQQQQHQQEVDEEGRGSVDTLRDQLPSIRIQTQLLHLNSVSLPRQQQKQQHGQDKSGGVGTGRGGGGGRGSGVLLSAMSDMSDRTVFDWQVQNHYRHYDPHPTRSSYPGSDDRHATPKLEVRHGEDKDKWIPPPPLPLPLSTLASQEPKHQYQDQQHLSTPYQQHQSRSWSSTIATPSRNWARQTWAWLQQYLSISTGTPPSHHHHHHHHHHSNQHSPFIASDDSPLTSTSSSTSTSTLLGEGAFHSRHHPYSQSHRHSTSTSLTSSLDTFLSLGDMESAKQCMKDEDRYFWQSPLTPRWSSRSFTFSFHLPRVWTGVFGRGRGRASASTSTPSTSSACLRLFTRRRKRTLYKWAWMASLMLVLTLAIYIAVVGVFKIHGYLAGSGGDPEVASGRNGDLVSRGRDVWRMSGKTVTTEQDGGVPTPAIFTPTAGIAAGSIWRRRADDEMDDRLDFYPDEDEDDPSEAASFISWLAQASIATPAIQQQDQQQHRPPQQYREYNEPPRPSPPPSRRHQGEPGQEPFLLEPERYFTYMPFAGISNQFYGMLRAMSIARALDRTLILPPITSSSHDRSRQNQAWSDFFDLDEFRRRTGLKVIEYQDLRDRGSFRGPTDVQESGSSFGASWIPPWVEETSTGETAKAISSADKRGGSGRYQHSLATGTSVVDMTMPCHATCGFGSKRDLDFTAKAFVRQWGFQYKKEMLPKSQSPSPSTPAPVDNSPIDQTRDFGRIIRALQDDSLKEEGFLCISNTYKIQISPDTPSSSVVDSIEWHDFGQHLLFQPQLTHFVDEFLGRTFGEHPEERTKYDNDTFWISPLPLSGPWSQPAPAPEPAHLLEPVPPQGDSPQLQPPDQPIALDVVDTPSSSPLAAPSAESQVAVSYATTLTPWPPLRPLIQHTFFMIHVRRGDFEVYCRKEFKDKRLDQCLPSNEAYARVINELQRRALRESRSSDDGSVDGDGNNDGSGHDRMQVEKKEEAVERSKSKGRRRRIPVLVATNENRPEELARLRELGRTRNAIRSAGVSNGDAIAGGSVGHDFEGRKKEKEEEEGEEGEGEEEGGEDEEWIILDHEEMKTVERLGVFGPMMVEQLLMAEAEALVGVRMSTFSRVGGFRQRDWYQRRTLYM